MVTPSVESDSRYLTDYACAVGRLLGNLLSLELLIRMVLYELERGPDSRAALGPALTTLKPGDTLPVSAFTSWDSLGQLIDKYNSAHASREASAQIDRSLTEVRNAFAHGRILADAPTAPLTLIRFAKPSQNTVRVESIQEMPLEWVTLHVRSVRAAIDKVHARLLEFPSQQDPSGAP